MSNTTTIFGVVALFAVGMIFSPLAASAAVPYSNYNGQYPEDDGNFLDIKKAIVKIDNDVVTDVIYKTGGFIPEVPPPFGYGVVTEVPSQTGTGTELNVIATTSHAGVLDADAQEGDPDNPILHTHYAVLGSNPACGSNPSIAALSEEEIGEVFVKGKAVIVKDLPTSATAEFNNTEIEITPGADIQFVASFLLQPEEDSQGNLVVCVTDIEQVQPEDQRTIIFGEKDFSDENDKPDYGKPYDYGYPAEESYDYEYPEESYDENFDYELEY